MPGRRPGSTKRQIGMWERRRKVEEFLRRGVTSRTQIAAALGVTIATASYDVQAVLETWRDEQPKKSSERRATRIRQLENIIQTAYNAWEISKQPGQQAVNITEMCRKCYGVEPEDGTECPQCKGEGTITRTHLTTKGQYGDPSFLNIIKECVKECARLEGQYAAQKQKIQIDHSGAVVHATLPPLPESALAGVDSDLLLAARSAIMNLSIGSGGFQKFRSSSDDEGD